LSVEEVVGQQQNAVSAALAQTDRVIGVVRLMREYLDTESSTDSQPPVALGPALRGVVAELSQIARERQVQLQLTGGCSATIALAEPRLRLALHYLIGVLIEKQPRQGEVTLRLEQGATESELRGQGATSEIAAPKMDPASAALYSVQLAVAQRLLQSAGATVEFGDGQSWFVLRVPSPPRAVSTDLFP
jgi:signal transduction histidine kinase